MTNDSNHSYWRQDTYKPLNIIGSRRSSFATGQGSERRSSFQLPANSSRRGSHSATFEGDLQRVKVLVEAGTNMDEADSYCRTSGLFAVRHNIQLVDQTFR